MNNDQLLSNIKVAKDYLANMIERISKQGANTAYLNSFLSGILQLEEKLQNGRNIDLAFLHLWDQYIGHAHRYFEGTSILEVLYKIDDDLKNITNNNERDHRIGFKF